MINECRVVGVERKKEDRDGDIYINKKGMY